MKKIAADLIITNVGSPLTDSYLLIDDRGTVIDIVPDNGEGDIERHHGVITPGFVNAHCHLELSHLKNQIDTGTGLIPFIKGVVTLRDFPQEIIDQAIIEADQLMFDNGIVAVGDISNKLDTRMVKDQSPIRYYTFVEMFDFLQEKDAKAIFQDYYKVYEEQSVQGDNEKSVVPHAPYSVSKNLFSAINELNGDNKVVSIHNQELIAENELFLNKSGKFIDFYRDFGIDIDQFEAIGHTSIRYAMEHMNPKNPTLFVHNTQSSLADIERAQRWNDHVYWVTCPNANLYIENRLPDYTKFIDTGATVCIGTDSLTSNWTLSVLEEMISIKKYQSYLDDLEIIRWGTLNGAKALGFDTNLGTIEKGKSPGINLIKLEVIDHKFTLAEAQGIQKLA